MKYLTKALNDAIDNDEFGVLVEEVTELVWKAVTDDTEGLPTVAEWVDTEDVELDPYLLSSYIVVSRDGLSYCIEHRLDWMI
jgi:hypothetical protein